MFISDLNESIIGYKVEFQVQGIFKTGFITRLQDGYEGTVKGINVNEEGKIHWFRSKVEDESTGSLRFLRLIKS